ncbi:hypothetical protein BQ8482_530032 [Mesorhizobium delmotii]|uniref:Uncharacterized protein n=1 Tax=Mesorhizobium delmotii TaxID=1631247 RepID=A0A2P9AUL9_9HYPH|nr:hypothetical protein BQ8482_530032 [Mesorhizobium delmotii]
MLVVKTTAATLGRLRCRKLPNHRVRDPVAAGAPKAAQAPWITKIRKSLAALADAKQAGGATRWLFCEEAQPLIKNPRRRWRARSANPTPQTGGPNQADNGAV